MKNYSSQAQSKFSMSNVHYVYNDEGIPVHKEDYKKESLQTPKQMVKTVDAVPVEDADNNRNTKNHN